MKLVLNFAPIESWITYRKILVGFFEIFLSPCDLFKTELDHDYSISSFKQKKRVLTVTI